MAESKSRLEDKDEWIFDSMNRYANLYMFDLEFPVDAFQVINDTSLCLSGLQIYSKNCEVVQLSIPPKLLPTNMKDGLCKDRDFNIISGGYSSHRITQIKSVHSNKRILATVQSGKAGVGLFELGDDNHAVIIPKESLGLPRLASSSLVQVMDTKGNKIILGNNFGKSIYVWELDSNISASACISHDIPEDIGGITKLKFLDENSVIFSTNKGTVAVYDLRGTKIKLEIQSSKFESYTSLQSKFGKGENPLPKETPISRAEDVLNQLGVSISTTKSLPIAEQKSVELVSESPNVPLIWSFDVVPQLQKVGMVDSYGGYETFDIRKTGIGIPPLTNRIILPHCNAKELLTQKFNIEYEPYIGFGSEVKFVVTGLKDENLIVYKDRVLGGVSEISPVFTHDGHSSTITHALWHPLTKNLLFSTATNSTLHAWQYIPR